MWQSIVTQGNFFFFQAEDGIRDGHVTGVQTCALPIWPPRPTRRDRRHRAVAVQPWRQLRHRGRPARRRRLHRPMTPLRALTTALAIAVVTATACTSSDDTSTASTAPPLPSTSASAATTTA